jgi:hypothetical protein
LIGTFWERSPSASSYRAEMFGLCGLHLLARALSEFYQIQEWEATLCRDNKQALEQSAYTRRRIRLSTKCADIQRSLKATKHTFTPARVWPTGQISPLAPIVTYKATKLRMRYAGQASGNFSNDARLPRSTNTTPA